MKTLFITTILASLLTLSALAADTNNVANTNQPGVLEQATVTARQAVATNLNEVVIDILRGAKSAGSEIYAASKTAITKSVDFTLEQAPLVVKEFLHWRLAQSIIWIFIWATPAIALLYFSRRFRLRSVATDVPDSDRYHTDKDDYTALKWIARVAALTMLLITIGINGMIITKIIVAPRVYLIEYVVDAIHDNSNHR